MPHADVDVSRASHLNVVGCAQDDDYPRGREKPCVDCPVTPASSPAVHLSLSICSWSVGKLTYSSCEALQMPHDECDCLGRCVGTESRTTFGTSWVFGSRSTPPSSAVFAGAARGASTRVVDHPCMQCLTARSVDLSAGCVWRCLPVRAGG